MVSKAAGGQCRLYEWSRVREIRKNLRDLRVSNCREPLVSGVDRTLILLTGRATAFGLREQQPVARPAM